MQEKTITKAQSYNMKKVSCILWGTSILPTLIWLVVYVIPAHNRSVRYWGKGFEASFYLFHILTPLLPFLILGTIIYLWTKDMELTVTDKRVYGIAAFGKRVDLPLDSISAVGTSWLKGIDVGTSSGRIKFKLVKNQKDVHSVMSKLIMERQQNKSVVVENIISTSNADELKKYMELLDSGIITQEEFEQKKKQLLDL